MKNIMQTKKFKIALAMIMCSVMLLSAHIAQASYNANAVGKITRVWTYYTGTVAFKIDPMPTTGCTYNDFFYINPDVYSTEAKNITVSILLAAMLSGKQVNVGYDNAGGACYSSRPFIYRVDVIQ